MIINFIIILCFLLLYFAYSINEKVLEKEEDIIFFEFCLYSAFYLLLKIGNVNGFNLIIFNILLILSFYKKRKLCSFLITVFILIIYSMHLHEYIILLTLIYIIFYISFILEAFKNLNVIIVLTTIFIFTTIYFDTFNLTYIEISLYYIGLTILLLKLLDKLSNTFNIYKALKSLEHDKLVTESLFKISHEIKNPLAVCKGYLDMFDKNNKEHLAYIPIIKEEVERSIFILNDFLCISKIKLNKEILDINMLIENLIRNYKPLFKNKNIKLNVELLDDEIFINADYNRLVQVFVNIIKNSIESIKDNGKIEIKEKIENNNILISIKDNGCGIENLEKIKEVFYTTKENGTGLGVPLSIEIIKKHDGDITYLSKIMEGTNVIIKLPIINSLD